MPERDWRMRIEDILEAISRITRYTSQMDYEAFIRDDKTIDAVIRNLELIGEAASYVPERVQGEYPQIPWGKMKGIRNILAHEYFGVSLPIIWQTVQQNITPLIPTLQKIVKDHPGE